jgi:hypothetical protein
MSVMTWGWFRGGTYIHCGQCKYRTRKAKKIRRHFRLEHS